MFVTSLLIWTCCYTLHGKSKDLLYISMKQHIYFLYLTIGLWCSVPEVQSSMYLQDYTFTACLCELFWSSLLYIHPRFTYLSSSKAHFSRYLHGSFFLYPWGPFLYVHPRLISLFVFKAHFSMYFWGSFLYVFLRLISLCAAEAQLCTQLQSVAFFVSPGRHESDHVYKSLAIFLVYDPGMGQAVTTKLSKWECRK